MALPVSPPPAVAPASSTPLVWIAEQTAAPSEEAKRALEAWAKARGVVLAPVAEGAGEAKGVAIDWSAAEQVDRGLARVRDALVGLDYEAAERELARAEAVLRAHPELPQAAWLRAEVERGWSARWLRSGDEARAKRAWQRAAGLDGGREPGVGERAFEPAAPITATIRIVGRGARAERATLRLDGRAIAAGEVKATEGEHALVIAGPAEGGEAADAQWAEWVSLAPGREVRIAAPEPRACGREDVRDVRLGEDGAVDAGGVRCAAWVVAVPGTDGVVRVATCEGETCGALVEWRSIAAGPAGWTFEPGTPAAEPRFHWPAWATWAVVGVGVAGAAVGIAAATGAFKSSAAPETQFVNGGITVRSF